MTVTAFRILLILLGATALLMLIEWYSTVRLRNDLERAEAQQQWASHEYEQSKGQGQ